MSKQSAWIISVIVILLNASCVGVNLYPTPIASTPLASPERELSAKTFSPIAGKGIVYIFRDTQKASNLKVSVFADRREVGSTVAGSFFRIVLDPGMHELLSRAETESNLNIQVEPGKVYFIAQVWEPIGNHRWPMSIFNGKYEHRLVVVSEDSGYQHVNKCRLLAIPLS